MINTVTKNGMRYYDINNGNLYPSVTSIIGYFSDDTGLQKWRDRVGEVEADRISEFSANRGSIMHQMLEYYFSDDIFKLDKSLKLAKVKSLIAEYVKENHFTDAEYLEGQTLFYNIYNSAFLDDVHRVVSLEDTLYSHRFGGYAGRVDMIYANQNNEIIILDFKTANKAKKQEWIDNYFLQIAAYFIAYWEMYHVKPTSCKICISNPNDLYPQIFTLNQQDIKKWAGKFLVLVKKFHEEMKS